MTPLAVYSLSLSEMSRLNRNRKVNKTRLASWPDRRGLKSWQTFAARLVLTRSHQTRDCFTLGTRITAGTASEAAAHFGRFKS